ncbi:hydroxypyruvate isomerase family protein [Maliponia aquimaris]|uniref:Putative hydroxypyruvate isomerase YgbM n=1 Tax=Maliponia aquimaris TaxID=1673631 RepID=A0A238KDX2_9RHOB|nr:TIM barrel protein [Maliponia aquimaris]SMX40990.1 Putative hydroxypyruvate isomerase YgbM [Maliponia aquimaris]
MKYSANLGFLWTELPLPDAIRAAAAAGFDAVECHWPYDTPAEEVAAALAETGLPMLGLNTRRGQPGEAGLAALPGRERDARAAIVEAIAYADAIDAGAIHVMAGTVSGPEAQAQFEANLRHACAATPRTILIEPLNRHDAPGYFLNSTDQARAIIDALALPNLKLMFDCYHVGRTEGDITTRLADLLPVIGHVQFAAVPDRGAPDHGEVNYAFVFGEIARLGWQPPLGAEYRPGGPTERSLGWMTTL